MVIMDVGKVLDKRNTFRSRNWSQTNLKMKGMQSEAIQNINRDYDIIKNVLSLKRAMDM